MYGVENGSVSTLVYHMLFFNPDAGAIKRIKDVELQWNRLLQVNLPVQLDRNSTMFGLIQNVVDGEF